MTPNATQFVPRPLAAKAASILARFTARLKSYPPNYSVPEIMPTRGRMSEQAAKNAKTIS